MTKDAPDRSNEVEPNRLHACCVTCRATVIAPASQSTCNECGTVVNPQGSDR